MCMGNVNKTYCVLQTLDLLQKLYSKLMDEKNNPVASNDESSFPCLVCGQIFSSQANISIAFKNQ